MHLVETLPLLDELLNRHAVEIGDDFAAYRNHAYRVANLCLALSAGGDSQLDKIAVAAAFHDLGIWTDRTFDYIPPSIKLARTYLSDAGQEESAADITEMIQEHRKVFRYRSNALAESFRRADWVDVSGGLIRCGLPRRFVNAVQSAWPDAGFHRRLFQLGFQRLRTHPWNPLPMVRL